MNLNDKAIKIQGKSYVLVSDRILYFNETYKEGCITTDLVKYEDKQIIIKATVYPEWLDGRTFTGYSQSIEWQGYINKTSALENAETSAVGRALAMMGIWVIDSIASVDEINKAKGAEDAENKQLVDWKPPYKKKHIDELEKNMKNFPWTYKMTVEELIAEKEKNFWLSDAMKDSIKELYDRLPKKEIPDEVGTTVDEAFSS